MWIDSHCHLNHPGIAEKGTPSDIITAAKQAGISGMVTICCRMAEEIETLCAITDAHENVWCSIGTHPHDAGLETEQAFTTDKIASLAQSHNNIIGIGETGLDYFYDNATARRTAGKLLQTVTRLHRDRSSRHRP